MSFSPQRLTMLVFCLQPIAFRSWLPRIPEIQASLRLRPAALALAPLAMPCGTLIPLPFTGLTGRLSTHPLKITHNPAAEIPGVL